MYEEELDYYDELENKKKFSAKKIAKLIFKIIAGIIIVGTFALIFGRIWLMEVPGSFTGFTWTEAAIEAHRNGELDVVLQTPSDSYDTDGSFNISNVALSKATGEVQFTVRYNSRSTVNTLMERYSLAERPSGEIFVYVLSDNHGNVYTDYVFASHSRPLYEFRRVIFRGVDLDGIYLTDEQRAYRDSIDRSDETAVLPTPDISTLYLTIYYGEDVSDKSLMKYSYVLYDSTLGTDNPVYDSAGTTDLIFRDAPVYISKLDEN